MSRFFPFLSAVSALGLILSPAVADDAQTALEVRELRVTVQQQAKQIESLAQQIAKLSQIIGGVKGPAAAATTEITKPAPEEVPDAPEIPKAEAVPQAPKHVVEKGETLTSIAKHYNVSLADLQKVNKITNDRKMQIGQTLIIPSLKAVETPVEKKETP